MFSPSTGILRGALIKLQLRVNYHIVIPIIILHRVNAWFRCNILFGWIYIYMCVDTGGKEISKTWIFFFFFPDRKREIDLCNANDDNSRVFKVCEKESYIFIRLSGKHLTPVETRAIHINAHYAKVITELVGWKFTFQGYRRIRTAGI